MPPNHLYTPFEQSLLASGLVDARQFAEARGPLPPGGNDAELARRLIDKGLLNEWQVEQLREGRTKFTLGQYAILDAVARGGMGHVFKARHQLLGRVEAIKVLPRSRSTTEAIASFRQEIRAQAQLTHPNLVSVSYADRDGDTYYLVTEFVAGVDLRRLVRRVGPLPPDAAAWVVLQAAEGLGYAHRRGIVHRDVKPGNLLVTQEGSVKLADLGLAWYLNNELPVDDGGRKKVVGTCDYVAPESITDPSRILPLSDIYALGCTLYYTVTGKVPYPGGNAIEKMRRCLREPPLPPQSIRHDLPKEIVQAIGTMMDKDLANRTPSAEAVIELLTPLTSEAACEAVVARVAKYEELKQQRQSHDHKPTKSSTSLISDTKIDSESDLSAGDQYSTDTSGALSTGSNPTNSDPLPRCDQPPRERPFYALDYVVWLVVAVALMSTAAVIVAMLATS